MTKIVIDPITRIEGHLRITCEVENGTVKDAWNTSTLFRGFEVFMRNQDPRDAWHFAQRICGVCPTPHAINSVTAAERAMGVEKIPDNARLVRNMLDASQIMYDCILWFYVLNAFDYVNVPDSLNATTDDPQLKLVQERIRSQVSSGQTNFLSNGYWDHPAYLLPPEENLALTAHYLESIPAQAAANRAAAVLAGKFPMIMTFATGGLTALPSIDQILYYQNQMQIAKDFTEVVMWNDMLAAATAYVDLAATGKGVGNYLTWGVLDGESQDSGDRVFPQGAIFAGDVANIYDVTPEEAKIYAKYSFYPDRLGGGLAPIESGQDPQEFDGYPPIDGPAFPEGKYDWTRAARYPSAIEAGKDVPMEVGPLAEVLVAYARGVPYVTSYVDEVLAALGVAGQPEVLLSNLGRIAARMIKARVNADFALQWSDELLANVKAGDTDVYVDPPSPGEGYGSSGSDAPRGALSHYCEVKGGRTSRYAAVPASNWNLSPRDEFDQRGPVEEALIGTPVADPEQPLEILRVVHTFDP
jgi:Ni,Fe-hydrogenase I large subunit